jgi:hypothetical protein
MLIDVFFSWNNDLSKQPKFGTKHTKFVSVFLDTVADETTLLPADDCLFPLPILTDLQPLSFQNVPSPPI